MPPVVLTEHISETQIAELLRAALGPRTELVACRFIKAGQFNTCYDIETAHPAQHVVLRVAPPAGLPMRRYERTMMRAEPFIYDYMRRAGVPIADVLCMDASHKLIDRDYIIIRFVEAVPLGHPSVPAEARRTLLREVGRCVTRMHGVRSPRFGWITADGTVRGSERWDDVFEEILTESCTLGIEAGVIEVGHADAMLACFGRQRAAFDECRASGLVHNDVWDPNILVKQIDGVWRLEALIDADRAFFADPEFEFILWDSPDADLMAGYGRAVDPSPAAGLRRQFYRMQLYLNYAWFYLLVSPNPGFQAKCRQIALDELERLATA